MVRFEHTQGSKIGNQEDISENIANRRESGKESCVAGAETAQRRDLGGCRVQRGALKILLGGIGW